MEIDYESYPLNEEANFTKEKSNKKQILLCHSNMGAMDHYEYWCDRYISKATPFSIDENGMIYQHYDPSYICEMFNDFAANQKIIPITLSNKGSLFKINNKLVNVFGIEVNDDFTNVKWRDREYFHNYTNKQLDSVVDLCSYLCDEYDIPTTVVNTNIKDEYIFYFSGIVYRSNYSEYHYDLSPAWNFKKFKSKVENNSVLKDTEIN